MKMNKIWSSNMGLMGQKYAKDDEEMTRLIHSMTDYQKEIMIKTLVSIVKKAHEEGFSMYCD